MKKLLIIKQDISAYNVPVYNKISEKFDLTVAFFSKNEAKEREYYKILKLDYMQCGPFFWVKNVFKLCRHYDVVSFVPDLHVLTFWLLPFIPRSYKLVNWSIGFRVSYIHPYLVDRKHGLVDWVFKILLKKSDACIFYMSKSKEFWKKSDLEFNKVFVAPNTTYVEPIEVNFEQKQNLLFVGTLYKGKGIDLLLKSYKAAIAKTGSRVKLVIVGKGEMYDYIQDYIRDNSLEGLVELKGAIYEEKLLASEFQKSLLCISPTQGGLSVPKSMGYAVPFITRKDAITGGEIYHIKDGVNGIIYNNDDDLTQIILDAITNPQKYIKMGLNAKEYYDNNATVNHMANGAIEAYNYALKN